MHYLIATLHTVGIKAGDVVTSRRERLRDEDGDSTIEVVFWVVAVLTSLIVPMQQTQLLFPRPELAAVSGVLILLFNLVQAYLLRTRGVAAPLIARIACYAVWHVTLGPLVVGR